MASLTGNQINNSYQGLLKTESNGALGVGLTNLTDGVGSLTGLSLNGTLNEFMYTRPNVEYSLKNTNFNKATYPMSATAGHSSYLNFKDANDQYAAYMQLDRYGSLYFVNVNGDQGEAHVFKSKTSAGVDTPAKISMDSWNGVNNSNNWYLGYQQSVDALTYNSGTGDLTLGRQDAADLVVNIPTGGGGGTPGLVNGTYGINSLKNADHLVNPSFPAKANFEHSIALGMNASSFAIGGISLGLSATTYGQYSVAISPGADARGFGDVSIGYNSDTVGSTGGSTSIGRESQARGQNCTAIGYGAHVNAGYANVNISDNHTIPDGQGNTVIGQSGGSLPTGQNDNVTLGRTSGVGSNTSNSISIGLVSTMGASANDSVTIGRGSGVGVINAGCQNSVAIGREARAEASNTTVVGAYASVTAPQATAIGYQAVAANSGWTATPQLELTNYATLNFADDTAAAAGGVPLGGIYHNAGALRIRIV